MKFHHSLIILLEILIGIIGSVISFILFITLAQAVVEKEGMYTDIALSHLIYSWRNPLLTKYMQFISFLGGEFIAFASVLIVLILVLKHYRKEAVFFGFTILVGYLLNGFLKSLLKVPRPDIAPLYSADFYGFPSGHTMNSFIFYAIATHLFFHFTRNKIMSLCLCLTSLILIFFIGLSRVYLGVHYPSDVAAGFIAGFWWFVTAIAIHKTLFFFKFAPSSDQSNPT